MMMRYILSSKLFSAPAKGYMIFPDWVDDSLLQWNRPNSQMGVEGWRKSFPGLGEPRWDVTDCDREMKPEKKERRDRKHTTLYSGPHSWHQSTSTRWLLEFEHHRWF